MKNRVLIWIALIVLLISLGACKPAEPDVNEPDVSEIEQEVPTQESAGEQAYPLETPQKPAAQGELAYPITQDDLGQIVKAWALSEAYIDGVSQEVTEKILEFKPDNTFQITTPNNVIAGNWTARLLAVESNLILTPSDGTLISYQIVTLDAESLVLSSIQDGKVLEEHFTPANW